MTAGERRKRRVNLAFSLFVNPPMRGLAGIAAVVGGSRDDRPAHWTGPRRVPLARGPMDGSVYGSHVGGFRNPHSGTSAVSTS